MIFGYFVLSFCTVCDYVISGDLFYFLTTIGVPTVVLCGFLSVCLFVF